LYTKQHAVEANLFLAPGEGDAEVAAENRQSSSNGGSDAALPDAIRLIRGRSN
jgi:hypothetical protein